MERAPEREPSATDPVRQPTLDPVLQNLDINKVRDWNPNYNIEQDKDVDLDR